MKLIAFIIAGIIFSSTAAAAEKEEACVKYRNENGWSKGYSVIATVISGSDLNSAVGSFTRFQSFATYAVVFWDDDQASILKLPPTSMGSLPLLESEVEDQYGRNWKIKDGHTFCN